jgi:hypothetical protein
MDDDKRRRLKLAFRRAMDASPNAGSKLVAFLLFPFVAAALDQEDDRERLRCERHGASSRPWVVCTHVCDGAPVATFQRFARGNVAGEVLCRSCHRSLDEAPPEALRLACELCVLGRWAN